MRRRVLLLALVVLAAGLSGAAWVGAFDSPGRPTAAGSKPQRQAGDPLDEAFRAPRGTPRPTAVKALPPGGEAEAGPDEGERSEEGEGPDPRLQKENKSLRRELDHLRALAAADRKVTRLLSAGPAGPIRRGSGNLIWPVNGAIVSPFGQRWGRLHAGVDLASPLGTPIRAAETGQVVIRGPVGGYGNYVCVLHTRALSTCYAHMSRFMTRKGALVRQGQVIGLVGCTGHCFGDHLHFETRVNGRPVDPAGYL